MQKVHVMYHLERSGPNVRKCSKIGPKLDRQSEIEAICLSCIFWFRHKVTLIFLLACTSSGLFSLLFSLCWRGGLYSLFVIFVCCPFWSFKFWSLFSTLISLLVPSKCLFTMQCWLPVALLLCSVSWQLNDNQVACHPTKRAPCPFRMNDDEWANSVQTLNANKMLHNEDIGTFSCAAFTKRV